MVKIEEKDTEKLYQCEICGFHYRDEETAQKCEAWCKEYNSCNTEIIKLAIENQETQEGPKKAF